MACGQRHQGWFRNTVTLFEAGKIESVIDRRYPLKRITETHKYVEKGGKWGNIVITVERDNKI
jgi:NADPH:quinone reductase-like Zn-dependent oxidoreductase